MVAIATAGCGSKDPASGKRVPSIGSGVKAAAPGVPTSKEGDNSIQTYGLEGTISERDHAASLVRAYLKARALRDWQEACGLLAGRQQRMLERIGRYSLGLRTSSCAEVEDILVPMGADDLLQAQSRIRVLSLRVGAGRGFLIYRSGAGDGIFTTAMVEEKGRWRIFSIAPFPVG